ncbi:MAG: class I SAM-dependent methyltransferase [Candidatus Acidiferrales bacterium]
MSPEGPQKSNATRLPQWHRWLRRCFGAGAYPTLNRWLDPSRQYSQVAYAGLLPELVPSGSAWLDAGCGHQVFKLGSARGEAEIVARTRLAIGCDLSWQSLRTHRTLKMRTCADLRWLPFMAETFDIVTLNYVAEHLEEPEKTFGELARLLRPEGTLVVVTPNSLGYFVRLTCLGRKFLPESLVRKFILLREFRSPEDVFPTFYRANTRDDLARHMERAGLKEVNFKMLKDPAVFNFIAPLAVLELLFGRLLSLLGFRNLVGGTIIGVYRKACDCLDSSAQRMDQVRSAGTLLRSAGGAQ